MSAPEPLTDKTGAVLGYRCPACATVVKHEEKAREHCEGTDAPDYSDVQPRSWPAGVRRRDAWMPTDGKMPFAKYHDHPALPYYRDPECERTTSDPRRSWSDPSNWRGFETVDRWVQMDPEADSEAALVGRAFIMQREGEPYRERGEADTFLFADGDNVRDPETGAVIPEFPAAIEQLTGGEPTFQEISSSDAGVHGLGEGRLPEGTRTKYIKLRDEPVFGHDEPPMLELYEGPKVAVLSGRRVAGTPEEIADVDPDGLAELLEEGTDAHPNVLAAAAKRSGASGEGESEAAKDSVTPSIEASGAAGELPDEAPADLPRCYERALRARAGDPEAVEGVRMNAHGVNLIASNLAVHAGFDVVDAVEHFEHFAPAGGSFKRSITEKSLDGTRAKAEKDDLAPPTVSTLRETGLFADGETCSPDCPIHASAHIDNGENSDGGEPVSVLPLGQLDALDSDERWRAARKRGLEWPTTDDLRDRLRGRIHDAVRDGEDVVIPAPTGAGKSFTVATEEWRELEEVTDGSPVIQLSETCDARDSARGDTREHGGEGAMLRGRAEACPVARGDHDPEECEDGDQAITIDGQPASAWLNEVCDGRNVAFSAAHAWLDEYNDQQAPLPCSPPVDDSPDAGRYPCPAVAQWEGVPRDDEGAPTNDVVHATHNFAHVPGLVQDSIVVVDEQPDYTVELGQDRVRRAIAAYLKEIDAPVSTFETFVSLARLADDAYGTDAGIEAEAVGNALDSGSPSREWYLTDPDAHTLAPAIARAIWYALRDDPDANGRHSAIVAHEPPRLDAHAHDDAAWNREWVSIVLTENNDVRQVRSAPDLSGARCVIGLDAHPTPALWQLNTRPKIQVDPLLDTDERRLWRRFERGLTVVQVGENTRPAGKDGKYAQRDRGRGVFLKHLREHFGSEFSTALGPKAVGGVIEHELDGAGVADPQVMTYGEEKSRNDFAGEAVGAVLGCIDAGDDYVLDTLAELGLDATPETDVDEDGEEFRAYGREFVGEDADTAGALVGSVRETHVAQSAGRYARDADDPDDTATVFVRTDALPVGLADYQVAGVTHVAGDKQRAIAEAARENPGATARELQELASDWLAGDETVSKTHVSKTLAGFLDRGVMQRRRGCGAYGADQWNGDDLTDAAVAGDVDLGELQDRVLSLYGSLEYQYAIHDLSASLSPSGVAKEWGSLSPTVANGGDRTDHDPS
jgi:hypothetical protein